MGCIDVLNRIMYSEDDVDYAKAEWNLNNLPVVANSILKQIDIDISGASKIEPIRRNKRVCFRRDSSNKI